MRQISSYLGTICILFIDIVSSSEDVALNDVITSDLWNATDVEGRERAPI
jgi:hypothetical protein